MSYPFCSLAHLLGPLFDLVLPFKWFESEVSGMYQKLLTFIKEVSRLFTTFIISSKASIVHLPRWVKVGTLFLFVDLSTFSVVLGGMFSFIHCWNVKMLLCIEYWSHVCSLKRLFIPQNLKSCNPTLNHPHHQTNLLVDWCMLMI
jgi:hypothetical protein